MAPAGGAADSDSPRNRTLRNFNCSALRQSVETILALHRDPDNAALNVRVGESDTLRRRWKLHWHSAMEEWGLLDAGTA